MATKTKALSAKQAEVLALLVAGGEIRDDLFGGTRVVMTAGSGIKRTPMSSATLTALVQRGYVVQTGRKYPDYLYGITEAGRAALEAAK
jgi:hypothetical protein